MDRERFNDANLRMNGPDRPPVITEVVRGGHTVENPDRLVVSIRQSLTSPKLVRGQVIGGGSSREALRRARRRIGRSDYTSIIDFKSKTF